MGAAKRLFMRSEFIDFILMPYNFYVEIFMAVSKWSQLGQFAYENNGHLSEYLYYSL